jgi:hypothetical protein
MLRAALQVSLLGDVPVSSGQASDLMGWKEMSRRSLLQRTGALARLEMLVMQPCGGHLLLCAGL